jgi:hypothetical protein
MTAERVSVELLGNFEEESEGFLQQVVTGEEIWVHHCDLENERQSIEYHHKGSPVPKKFKTKTPAGKVMLVVFWKSECVMVTDFL